MLQWNLKNWKVQKKKFLIKLIRFKIFKKKNYWIDQTKLGLEDENPILTLLEIGKQTLNKEETYFEILDLIKEYGNETQPNNNESKIKLINF